MYVYMLLKILSDFLLLTCILTVEFLDQPEEPWRVEENFFLLDCNYS